MKITIEHNDGSKIEYSDVKEIFISGVIASPEHFVKTGHPYTEFHYWDGSYPNLIGKLYYYLHKLKEEESANIHREPSGNST